MIFQIFRKRSVFGYYVEDVEPDFETECNAVQSDYRTIYVTDISGKLHTFKVDTFNYNYYTIGGMNNTKSKFI